MSNKSDQNNRNTNGRLVVISGPSGSGKTTICEQLIKDPRIIRSISFTTRGPRDDEKDGIDYHFIKKGEFEKLVEEDKFVEYAEYCGSLYGTPIGPIEEAIKEGKIFVLTIDVQGAIQIKKKISEVTSIFIMPPDDEVLRQRLSRRDTDSEEDINKRLKVAKDELEYRKYYDYSVINGQLDDTVHEIKELLGIGDKIT